MLAATVWPSLGIALSFVFAQLCFGSQTNSSTISGCVAPFLRHSGDTPAVASASCGASMGRCINSTHIEASSPVRSPDGLLASIPIVACGASLACLGIVYCVLAMLRLATAFTSCEARRRAKRGQNARIALQKPRGGVNALRQCASGMFDPRRWGRNPVFGIVRHGRNWAHVVANAHAQRRRLSRICATVRLRQHPLRSQLPGRVAPTLWSMSHLSSPCAQLLVFFSVSPPLVIALCNGAPFRSWSSCNACPHACRLPRPSPGGTYLARADGAPTLGVGRRFFRKSAGGCLLPWIRWYSTAFCSIAPSWRLLCISKVQHRSFILNIHTLPFAIVNCVWFVPNRC